jgi:hypothetical protein
VTEGQWPQWIALQQHHQGCWLSCWVLQNAVQECVYMCALVLILCAVWQERVGLWQAAVLLGICSSDGAVECNAAICAGFIFAFQVLATRVLQNAVQECAGMLVLVLILCEGWREGVGLWQAAAALGVYCADGAVEWSAVTSAGFLLLFRHMKTKGAA